MNRQSSIHHGVHPSNSEDCWSPSTQQKLRALGWNRSMVKGAFEHHQNVAMHVVGQNFVGDMLDRGPDQWLAEKPGFDQRKIECLQALMDEGLDLHGENKIHQTVWSYCFEHKGPLVDWLMSHWNPEYAIASSFSWLHQWWNDDFLAVALVGSKPAHISEQEYICSYMKPYFHLFWAHGWHHGEVKKRKLVPGEREQPALESIIHACFGVPPQLLHQMYEKWRLNQLLESSPVHMAPSLPKIRL